MWAFSPISVHCHQAITFLYFFTYLVAHFCLFSLADNNIDYITLQQELSTLSSKYEEMCDKNEENERKVKLMERENRAYMMNNDDEKRRNLATIDELTLKVNELESKLNNKRLSGGNSGVAGIGTGNSGFLFSSASVDAGDGASPQKDGKGFV